MPRNSWPIQNVLHVFCLFVCLVFVFFLGGGTFSFGNFCIINFLLFSLSVLIFAVLVVFLSFWREKT